MKYFIKTFGCQMNHSDSERIAGFLELQPRPSPLLGKEREFVLAKDIDQADLVIFNTCGVRQTAEDRVYGQIHNLRKTRSTKHATIILTGCLADRKDVQRRLKDKVDLFCETKNVESIMYYVSSIKYKKIHDTSYIIHDTSKLNCDYLKIRPKYSNKFSAYIPIMTGCNNFCSYCVVPYARGREVSRPAEDIVREIANLSKKGCEEITLLGQNVNSYNYVNSNSKLVIRDNQKNPNYKLPIANCAKINFPILLNLLSGFYPKINFKFLTSHPKDFSPELIKVITQNKNISREIHLPVQAGSNKILKLMNRPYTQKKYLALIGKIKKKIPNATFTTDIIVGFPGETEKDFSQSVKVFKKVRYSEAYINKYSPRPGTAAWKMGNPISWKEKKRREKILRSFIGYEKKK